MKERRITAAELAALTAGDTDAHRLRTITDGWVDRFGDDYLVSAANEAAAARLLAELPADLAALGLASRRVFRRQLVKQPGQDDRPVQVGGGFDEVTTVVRERGLRFGLDFAAGYSVGLFCDQRANRAHLESLAPRRVLNCFAYTCAFTVAAARAGAETLSLDLSRKSLDRGRANLALNGFAEAGRHRFVADDVFAVLPRLARRGERFDVLVLDPPTFSRGERGRVFRVERDLPALVALAAAVADEGAHLLVSTNARSLDERALRSVDLEGRKVAAVHRVPPPGEYPPGAASTTLWLTLG